MPCTTILVGRNATNDHSTLISRNDDGSFEAKRIGIMRPEDQPREYKSVIAHLTVPLPDNPLRYTYKPNIAGGSGVWPACGINAANVAMTATETISSNPRVLAADPLVTYRPAEGDKPEVPGGIGEEDLVILILPYIRTAREGVLRMGALLEQYGTYESNGLAFADADEVWWMETIGGHHWIARRVPDDRVVIMPNQFGLDNFDFSDAMGPAREHLCSADLLEFTEKNCLYTGDDFSRFNPRLAYGSRTEHDNIYNTPRAWYMARYFLGETFRFDGEGAFYTPLSFNLPWSFVPERKVTVEDVRYLLGSFYQGTPYNPYDATSPVHGKYRVIGVPNSDVCGILTVRGDLPEAVRGVEWLSFGGSGFTASFPFYANVDTVPAYFGETKEAVSTENIYWQSRLIAALTDAHYASNIMADDRYRSQVAVKGREILCEYDALADASKLPEANQKVADMVKAASDKVLGQLLAAASEHMKTRFHRGDN